MEGEVCVDEWRNSSKKANDFGPYRSFRLERCCWRSVFSSCEWKLYHVWHFWCQQNFTFKPVCLFLLPVSFCVCSHWLILFSNRTRLITFSTNRRGIIKQDFQDLQSFYRSVPEGIELFSIKYCFYCAFLGWFFFLFYVPETGCTSQVSFSC